MSAAAEGHYLPPLYAVGSPCPVVAMWTESEATTGGGAEVLADVGVESELPRGEIAGADDIAETETRAVCPGVMLDPRPGTGVRSLWHWAGLIPEARLRKGARASWDPRVKTSCLMKYGLAYQIVNHRAQPYRGVYDDAKARILAERPELPPWRVEKIARKIAAKAFLGDLLVEWKRLVAPETGNASVLASGGDQ